ncbi:hypothetical protein DPM19_18475 [Actinomadura craniellae]|uniref:Uncharacterized protein n=1 Tax=Actinomadura craniellae TaxID=2231787 RepID=A0A365H3H3_9ACTN|nr:hypothetical protein [Actinomadura craniellae]RAY13655.1 hypothetical protein DPM19_18475 [Actinomadura craniellae]
MYKYTSVAGDPIPARDGFAVDDQDESEDSTVVSLGTVDEHDLVQIAAWDDGMGLDVELLLTLPHARAVRDRLSEAIRIIEERGKTPR